MNIFELRKFIISTLLKERKVNLSGWSRELKKRMRFGIEAGTDDTDGFERIAHEGFNRISGLWGFLETNHLLQR